LVLLETEGADLPEHEKITLEIQFENTLQRDAFLLTARIMRIKRNIPMSTILHNVDHMILNYWYPCNIEKRDSFSTDYR
jgi:hypothetical protein